MLKPQGFFPLILPGLVRLIGCGRARETVGGEVPGREMDIEDFLLIGGELSLVVPLLHNQIQTVSVRLKSRIQSWQKNKQTSSL